MYIRELECHQQQKQRLTAWHGSTVVHLRLHPRWEQGSSELLLSARKACEPMAATHIKK